MRRDFDDAVRAERRTRGIFGAIVFALGAFADVLLTAIGERSGMVCRDLVFAFRSLRKTPVFAAIVIATLALAIAANATVFSILRAVVLAPLPYANADRLASLVGTKDGAPFSLSLPDFRDLRAQSASFESLAAFAPRNGTSTGRGIPQRLLGISTTPGLFETLSVRPMLGRTFTNADARAGSAPVVVISESLWRTAFASDAHAVGSNLTLDGKAFRVIGVVPATFRQPNFDDGDLEEESFWVPLDPSSTEQQYGRGAHYFQAVGLVRSGVPIEKARADLATIFARLARANPAEDKHYGVAVNSAYETIVGDVRPLLIAIFAAVAGVLLVACANVASLLLSRAAAREREFAIRTAVGASRGRLIAQQLVETFLFATLGGALGCVLASVTLRAFVDSHPAGLPRLHDARFDVPAAFFTLAVVALCTVMAGLVPALALSRHGVGDTLKSAGRGGDGARGARVRGVLVVAEVALTLALVVSSGLVVRSFFALTAQPLGFEPGGLTAVGVQIPPSASSDAALSTFLSRIEARVRALPGVTDSAWCYSAPFTRRSFSLGFDFADRRAPAGEQPTSQMNTIGPDYFSTLRERVIAGRTFRESDLGSAHVAIVNEAFARKYFAGRQPLGSGLIFGLSSDAGAPKPSRIVGIVADARTTYAVEAQPTVYLPRGFFNTPNMLLMVRARSGALRAADIGAIFTAIDPLAAHPKLTPLETYLAEDTAQTRLAALALGALAFIALALSLAGIFAVVSYGVAQRTHEFGIRMALGARAWHVMRSAVGSAMRLVACGVAVGLVVAALTTRLISGQLYEVAPLDPLTFGAVTFAMVAAALAAALIPAGRATRVDPVVALRYE